MLEQKDKRPAPVAADAGLTKSDNHTGPEQSLPQALAPTITAQPVAVSTAKVDALPIEADAGAVADFLNLIATTDFLAVISIDPEVTTAGRRVEAKPFDRTDVGEAAAWAASESNRGRNLYFVPNEVSSTWKGPNPPTKEEMTACHYLFADLDPKATEDLREERDRILARLTNTISQDVPLPTGIIDSGNGYQAYWKLEQPISPAEAEARIKQLAFILEGDAVQNINRMLRLPGTVNIPDAKKRKIGRVRSLAGLIEWHPDRTYSARRFRSAEQTLPPRPTDISQSLQRRTVTLEELEELEVSRSIQVLILHGRDPAEPSKYPSRSEALFAVCCDLARRGLPDDIIYSVITDPDYGISASVLDKKDHNAYAARQIRRARDCTISPELDELNERHAVIGSIGGKCRVMVREPSPISPDKELLKFQTFADFRNQYSNRFVEDGKKDLGSWWLRHPRRRQYAGVIYDPTKPEETGGRLNLWRGFGVEPVPGDWSLFRAHIEEVLAAGDPQAADYIIKWAAWAIQNPHLPAEVALVFRGGRGTGKGTFGTALKELFGQHGLQISSAEHLSGRFNAHLRDVSMLFADEAYWPGDKSAEGNLKRLITEPTLAIEAKGVDLEETKNCLHVIMASNEDWVVPAGPDERRYAAFDVAEHRKGDRDWFGKIKKQLQDGGLSALLHDLQAMDLGEWHPRQIYRTAALAQQKARSLPPEDEWIEMLLQDGVLPADRSMAENGIAYSHRLRHDARLRVPRLSHVSDKRLGAALKRYGCQPWSDGGHRGWRFPPLPLARERWGHRFGPWVWEKPDLVAWIPDEDVPF